MELPRFYCPGMSTFALQAWFITDDRGRRHQCRYRVAVNPIAEAVQSMLQEVLRMIQRHLLGPAGLKADEAEPRLPLIL